METGHSMNSRAQVSTETPLATQAIADEFRDILPAQAVHGGTEELTQWQIDGVAPRCAVSPANAIEVAEVLKLCSVRNWSVFPAGGFTAQSAGRRALAFDVLLRTDRLNQVAFYDPGDLTVGLGAGMTIAAQRALLRENRQWLPLGGRDASLSTIGGLAATAASGPLAASFGGLREYCIGIEFVTSDGKIAHGGGRVVKNVAGYDLMKLLIGSHGTLGVITQVNFKVFPSPRQTRTFLIECSSAEELVATRDRLSRTPFAPLCLEALSPYAQEVLEHLEQPRDPDDYAPAENDADGAAAGTKTKQWLLALRASGSDAVLARYRQELRKNAVELAGGEEAEFWNTIDSFPNRVFAQYRNGLVLQVGCATDQVAATLATCVRVPLEFDLLPAIIGRAASGSFLVGLLPLAVGPPSAARFAKAVVNIRVELPAGAIANVLSMPPEMKQHCDPWEIRGADLALMRSVKQAFDPAGILNRGRYLV